MITTTIIAFAGGYAITAYVLTSALAAALLYACCVVSGRISREAGEG